MKHAEPALESKVAHLREPGSYPGHTYRVEAMETHMSWLFLLDDHVYKLKKPVCYEYLDFRTPEARHTYCDEELRLNRRLAPAVYLGVVALTLDEQGHLQLDGSGAPVDWLVKMRRLPAHNMLDYAILHKSVTDLDIERIASRLATFYQVLPAELTEPQRYRARLRCRIESNLDELSHAAYRLPIDQVRAVALAQECALDRIAGLLDARVAEGRIIEGHGDLRPEHICLVPDIVAIDSLEFARELRIVDMADELAFLALECERIGAPAIGPLLLRSYSALSGDAPQPALVHFYQSCRASTRATIAARHLKEAKFRYSPHWVHRARHYLHLALAHIGQCR